MRYKQLYKKFIQNIRKMNRTDDGKYTVHHIVPRSMHGSDSADNKILLTPREHYIAHRLIAKQYQKKHPEIYYLLNTFANGMKGQDGIRLSDFNFYWKKYVSLKTMGVKEKSVMEALYLAQRETMRLINLPGTDVNAIMLKVMVYSTGKDFISCG